MAEIIKCYKIHADVNQSKGLNTLVEKLIKISDITFDCDNIVVWLNDDKDKKDLIRVLKNCGIVEYFCEPIAAEDVTRDDNYNFLSTWFMEKHSSFLQRQYEIQNQDELQKMYNNIQRAQKRLEDLKTGAANASMNKQI